MASCLVMKNNLMRLMKRKSTYYTMIIVPVLLMIISSISIRFEEQMIRVGVVGTKYFLEEIKAEFAGQQGVAFAIADGDRLHTDRIMGKCHYVIVEEDEREQREETLNQIRTVLAKEAATGNTTSSDMGATAQKMAAMLLTVYMTIATIYSMKYLKDKRDGVVERFQISGGGKRGYIGGYLFSTSIIISVQIMMVLCFWSLFEEAFQLPITTLLKVFFLLTVVSTLYAMFVTLISNSELMAGVLGSSGAALLSILGGTFIAVENMPVILQKISVISPMSWLMKMISS